MASKLNQKICTENTCIFPRSTLQLRDLALKSIEMGLQLYPFVDVAELSEKVRNAQTKHHRSSDSFHHIYLSS